MRVVSEELRRIDIALVAKRRRSIHDKFTFIRLPVTASAVASKNESLGS